MGGKPDSAPTLWGPISTAKYSRKHRCILSHRVWNVFFRLQHLRLRAIEYLSPEAIFELACMIPLPPPPENEEAELWDDSVIRDSQTPTQEESNDTSGEENESPPQLSQPMGDPLHDAELFDAMRQALEKFQAEQLSTLEDSWLAIVNDCPDQVDPFDHLALVGSDEVDKISDNTSSSYDEESSEESSDEDSDTDLDGPDIPNPSPSPSGREQHKKETKKVEYKPNVLNVPWSQSFAGQLESYIDELEEEAILQDASHPPIQHDSGTTVASTDEKPPAKRQVSAQQFLRLVTDLEYTLKAYRSLSETIREELKIRAEHYKRQLKGRGRDGTHLLLSKGYGSPLMEVISAEEEWPSPFDDWEIAAMWNWKCWRPKIVGKLASTRLGASIDRSGIMRASERFGIEDDRFW